MTHTELDIDINKLINNALDEDIESPKSLILWNDDLSPIDLVMKTIIDVCKYPKEQAEQITFIAHMKGKANLKNGSQEELETIREKFQSRNIYTTIE